jgi:hypothetical protein
VVAISLFVAFAFSSVLSGVDAFSGLDVACVDGADVSFTAFLLGTDASCLEVLVNNTGHFFASVCSNAVDAIWRWDLGALWRVVGVVDTSLVSADSSGALFGGGALGVVEFVNALSIDWVARVGGAWD